MAKKKKPAEPAIVTDADVQAKRAACGYALTVEQCRQVLEAQAAHDATEPHDEPPAAEETAEA